MMKLTIIGNLGSDPVDKTTDNTKIIKFSVGVSVRRKKEFVTQWVEVAIFGNQFDKLLPSLLKGAKVCVTGSFDISHDERTNKNYWNLLPDSISVIMSPKAPQKESYSKPWSSSEKLSVSDDDIPF